MWMDVKPIAARTSMYLQRGVAAPESPQLSCSPGHFGAISSLHTLTRCTATGASNQQEEGPFPAGSCALSRGQAACALQEHGLEGRAATEHGDEVRKWGRDL